MTDEPDRYESSRPPDPDPEVEAATGLPLDALFQVETSGEADHETDETEQAPTGLGGASFSMDEQLGEEVPPELRGSASDSTSEEHDIPQPASEPSPEVPEQPDLLGFEPFDLGDVIEDPSLADDGPAEDGPAEDGPAEDGPAEDAHDDGFDLPRRSESDRPAVDWEQFTHDDYLSSSTSEYQGLAAELERTRHEETEQIAVAANMPGMETGVVGLEDVTGEDVAVVHDQPSNLLADVGIRIATGLGLLAVFFASLLWPAALGTLAVVVFVLAAGEFYAVLVRTGHHPLAVFGLLGVLGCLIGAWVWGVQAIPVALIATTFAVVLFYGMSTPRSHAMRDAALTVLGAAWIGGFGAFVLPIVTADEYAWLITGVVVIVVALDVGQFFAGRAFGRRPLAPIVSPKKTIEGLVGGALLTFAVAYGLSFFGPFDRMSTLVLAAAAIVLGPLGDLSVSSIKRWIGVKDMGTVLPGHGGILDRIDALLFVIPAAWVVYSATGLLV